MLGLIVPIFVFAVSASQLITEVWWFSGIPYVWPTYLMMLPFSGPLDAITFGVLILSAVANSFIYAAIGSALAVVFYLSRRSRNDAASQP